MNSSISVFYARLANRLKDTFHSYQNGDEVTIDIKDIFMLLLAQIFLDERLCKVTCIQYQSLPSSEH